MTFVLPVIHHRDDATTFENARLANGAGCRGVVLIQMEGDDEALDRPALAIKDAWPEMLVGTNRISTPPHQAIRRDAELGLDLSWADDAGVSSAGATALARRIQEARLLARREVPEHLFFGSVAFKTQRRDPDPAAAALLAADLGWVVTTSGVATGHAPEPEKLAAMKAAIGARPLAVASGVTPENAAALAPHVDWILVATGIGRNFHEVDPDRLAALMAVVGRGA